MVEHSPTVRHRTLAAELRRRREAAGLTPEDAAAALGWSRPKLVKIETARVKPTRDDVDRILSLYGAPAVITLALQSLTRDINQRGWWAAFDDVLTGSFAELEDAAKQIRNWQIELVPGLLQTKDYALTLIRSTATGDEVDRRLQARMTRQTVLARQNAPMLTVLLDEAVLRRPIGGAEIMRDQIKALITAAQRPNVSIRVLPASAGVHAALGEGSFTIFGFERQIDLDVVYLESVAGGIYVEEVAKVRGCNVRFDQIAAAALSDTETLALLGSMTKE